jgi:hypothetical protein
LIAPAILAYDAVNGTNVIVVAALAVIATDAVSAYDAVSGVKVIKLAVAAYEADS